MRVAVVGSRNWFNRARIEEELLALEAGLQEGEILTVISGGAQGADTIAVEIAKNHGCDTVVYQANWVKWAKSAGPIRNREMLTKGEPDLVLAFKKGNYSLGTDDAIRVARELKIPVAVFTEE